MIKKKEGGFTSNLFKLFNSLDLPESKELKRTQRILPTDDSSLRSFSIVLLKEYGVGHDTLLDEIDKDGDAKIYGEENRRHVAECVAAVLNKYPYFTFQHPQPSIGSSSADV